MSDFFSEHPKVPYQPSEVVAKLIAYPSSNSGEWNVVPSFTIRQVAELVSYRIEEVLFTEDKETLWVNARVSTADESVGDDRFDQLHRRSAQGRLLAHIHPSNPNPQINKFHRPINTFLSWPDIWNITFEPNPNARYVLFHRLSGIEYTMPKLGDKSAHELLEEFSKEIKVDCYPIPNSNLENMPHIIYLSREKQIDLAREFTAQTAMIKQESTWDDKEGIQHLIDIINLKST